MNPFKQMVEIDDLKNVFFRGGELGEIDDDYEIDGKLMPVVQDDNRILDRSDLAALGTDIGEGLIFVQAVDMPHIPIPGSQLSIKKPGDEKSTMWFVVTAKDNRKVYEIRLSRRQQSW